MTQVCAKSEPPKQPSRRLDASRVRDEGRHLMTADAQAWRGTLLATPHRARGDQTRASMPPLRRVDASGDRDDGRQAMNGDAEALFCEFVAARQQALLRTAYLLTSDLHSAEDLVQISLAKAYLAWDRLRDPQAVEAYVRKIMV